MGDWDEVEAAAVVVIVCALLALGSIGAWLIAEGLG
jgi:hypothetical protein